MALVVIFPEDPKNGKPSYDEGMEFWSFILILVVALVVDYFLLYEFFRFIVWLAKVVIRALS